VCRVFYRVLANLDALEVVSDLQATLRTDHRYLAPTVSESWLRQYQVSQFNAHSDFYLLPFLGTSWPHPSTDDDVWRRRIFTTCHKNVCSVISELRESNLLTPTHNYCCRYDDPSAEPVAVHRRSKATKQTVESSQELSEDSTTQASRLENIHHADLCVEL
jgi:hypothetical protein